MDDIIKIARTYLDTPFHHQGRRKGVGIDCGGLIICTLDECNKSIKDLKGYSRFPHADSMRKHLRAHFDEIDKDDMRNGDILLFNLGREPSHVAFKTDRGMIHAYIKAGKVIEHSMDYRWYQRLISIFRVRNV